MRKAKKLIVLALTCVMLLGSSLAVQAATCTSPYGHEGSVKYNNPSGSMYGQCTHCRYCGSHLGNSHVSDLQYICYK